MPELREGWRLKPERENSARPHRAIEIQASGDSVGRKMKLRPFQQGIARHKDAQVGPLGLRESRPVPASAFSELPAPYLRR